MLEQFLITINLEVLNAPSGWHFSLVRPVAGGGVEMDIEHSHKFLPGERFLIVAEKIENTAFHQQQARWSWPCQVLRSTGEDHHVMVVRGPESSMITLNNVYLRPLSEPLESQKWRLRSIHDPGLKNNSQKPTSGPSSSLDWD